MLTNQEIFLYTPTTRPRSIVDHVHHCPYPEQETEIQEPAKGTSTIILTIKWVFMVYLFN